MLSRSLKIQSNVICALLRREVITRYGRHNIGVLWLVFEPMLFTLGIASLWYITKLHTVSNIPIFAFALTGYSSVLVWRNAANRSIKAVEVNIGLMYHKNVKVIDILISRILLEIIGGTASFIVLTFFFVFTNAISWPEDVEILIEGWLLLCWFALALGMTVGALSELSDTFERMWHISTYLMFPLSGAVFMVHWLPTPAQEAIFWLPMVHGVEMVRHGYFGNVIPTYESPFFFIIVNMALSLIGLALVRDAEKRVQPE